MTVYKVYDVISKILLSQLMCIYLKNNRAIFHPDLIWNDRAIGFLDECHPRQEEA